MINKINSHNNNTGHIYYLLFKEKLLKFVNLFFKRERFVLSENGQNAINFYRRRQVTQLSGKDSPTSRAANRIFSFPSERSSFSEPPEEASEVGHLWDKELNLTNSEKIIKAFGEVDEAVQKHIAEGIASPEEIREKIIKQYQIEHEDNFFDNALSFAGNKLAKKLSELIKERLVNKKTSIKLRELLVTAEKEWIVKREGANVEDLYKKTLDFLKDKDPLVKNRLVAIAQHIESKYNFPEEKKVKFQFLTAKACNKIQILMNYGKDLELLDDFKVEDSIHKRKIYFQDKLLKIIEGKDGSSSLKELSEEIKQIKNREIDGKRWKHGKKWEQWLYSELVTSLDEEHRKKWVEMSINNEGDEEMKEQLLTSMGEKNET